MPYKDTLLLIAQILSIPAFALSVFSFEWYHWWIIFPISLAAFIVFQIVWCCAMHRAGIIVAASLGLTAASFMIYSALDIADERINHVEDYVEDRCGWYLTDSCESQYMNDDVYATNCEELYENCLYWIERNKQSKMRPVIIMSISVVLWVIAGAIAIIFASTKRYERALQQLKEDRQNGLPHVNAIPVGRDVQMVPVSNSTVPMVPVETGVPVPGTQTTTRVTTLKDGTIERTTEVVNPDGSKTVTITTERTT